MIKYRSLFLLPFLPKCKARMPERIKHNTRPNECRRKRSLIEKIDRYLRDSDTIFAELARSICPYKGEEYLNSRCKRILDLTVAVPAAIIATPAVLVLGFAKKIEDGGSAFFIQERLNSGKETDNLEVVKIRCMKEDSDLGRGNIEVARGLRAHEDPRNTKLGIFLRRYQLEELPQLYQIVLGRLSLLGIRPIPKYVSEYLQESWSPKRFERWQRAYESGPLGLSGLNQTFGSLVKEEDKRYHFDVFYTKNASLGLDLYLLWRSIVRLTGTS